MPADEHLGEQFFHGTVSRLNEGDVIEPVSKSTWRKPRFPSDTDTEYAYATGHQEAWMYAEKAWHSAAAGVPRVFEVEPMGEHEPDPTRDAQGNLRGNYDADRRSKVGWRVLCPVPMPEEMGTEEEWR